VYREAPRVVHSNEAGTCSDQKSRGHNSTIEELTENMLRRVGGSLRTF